MLQDVLSGIKQAELTAEEAIQKATEQAKADVQAAQAKAEYAVSKATSDAKEYAKQEKQTAVDKAEAEAGKKMEEGLAEAKALALSKFKQVEELAEEIVDKVLSTYVNC